jgi:hypothetical protein
MGKKQADIVLDQSLNYISTNATEYYVCTSEPTDRADAIATSVTAAITPSYTGPADGDVSGRKLTIDAVSDEALTASGTVNHLALCSGTTLLYVTTATPQPVSSGGTVSIPSWDIEIADAS